MRGFCLEVSGDYACFTRPEMKVERVSYDVITPSAARAIYSAIFWKPAIKWHITKIEVLNPIRWTSVRRNEVSVVASLGSDGFCIDELKPDGGPKYRQQRAGLLLRDVKYRLFAELEYIEPKDRPKVINPAPEWMTDEDEKKMLKESELVRSDEKPGKYLAMFDRRASKGQYFMHPYLGCREFSCSTVRLIREAELPNEPQPILETRDLGFMLYDMDYSNPKDIQPMFYRAKMVNGTIYTDERKVEVLK